MICSEICDKKSNLNKTTNHKQLKIRKKTEDYEKIFLNPLEKESDYREKQLQIKNIDDLKINTNQCVIKRFGDPRKYYTWDDYEDELGWGAYGIVYKVKSILHQQERAIKKI